MKPLYLEFQAFGPYLKKQEIDFSSLYKNKLFLISGPTGSGKTTIFDALFYALYDKPLGYRNSSKIKSDFADFEKCYVKLEFSSKNKKYTVIRSPKQKLLKGGKTIIKDSSVELHLGDRIVTKKTEAKKYIEEIVGFDADQFSKLLIIPQGEAHKLLFSSSDEKEKLFRTLFGTLKYKELQDKLKDKMHEHFRSKEVSSNLLARFFKSLREYEEVLEDVEMRKYDSALKKLKLIQKENEKRSASFREKLENLNNEKTNMKEKSKLASEYIFYSQRHQKLKEKLDFSNELREENRLFDKYSYVNSLGEDIKNLESKIEKNSSDREEKLDRKKKLLEEIGTNESKLSEINKVHNKRNLILDLSGLKKRLRKVDEKITSHDAQLKHLNRELQSLEKAKEVVLEYEEIGQKISLFGKLIDIENTIAEIRKKLEKLMASREKYLSLEEEYRRHLLSEIASSLKEGDECPLCGSPHHPNLIVEESEYNYSDYRSELIEFEKDISSYNTKIDSLMKEFSLLSDIKIGSSNLEKEKLETRYLKLESELDDVKTQYLGDEISSLKLVSIISAKEERVKNISDFKVEKGKEKEEIIKSIEAIELEEKYFSLSGEELGKIVEVNDSDWIKHTSMDRDLRSDVKIIKNDLVNLTESTDSLTDELERKKESLTKYLSENALQKLSFENIIDREKYNQNLKWLEEYDRDKLIVETKLESLREYSEIDIDDMANRISDLDKKILNLNEEFDEIKGNSSILNHAVEEISSELPKYISSKENYDIFSKLFNVAEGKNASNISFERFVLSMHLEDVLLYANKRLGEVSSGRYHFRRKMEAIGGNRKEGLDIDIMDSNTKKVRDVRSLSGGEQFKAALCLALGISDYVSSYNGENDVSVLLIDEGFGTLSSDHLSSVINLISNIKRSGVLVGVISHVEELKEYIHTRINIEKDVNGSNINLCI